MLIYILVAIVYVLTAFQYVTYCKEHFQNLKSINIASVVMGLIWPILFIPSILITPIKYFKEYFSKKDATKGNTDDTDDRDDCYTEFQRQKRIEIDAAIYKAIESLISSDLKGPELNLFDPDIMTLTNHCRNVIIGYLRTNGYVAYYPHKDDSEGGSDRVIETYEPYDYLNDMSYIKNLEDKNDICEEEETKDEHCGE